MIRYLRLYLYFIRFSFSKALEFRLDFFFRIIMDCVYYMVNVGFYAVIFNHTNLLGGWKIEQVYVFVGGYFVLDALMMTVFSNNLWWLPTYINKGDLDYYLVRPVGSLFFLSLREFAANSFMNVVIAAGYWIWAISVYPDPWTWWQLMIYVLLVINGTFLYYLLHLLSAIPIFWTQSSQSYMDLMFSLSSFMERPHRIFDGWTRKVLTTVLPFCLMASYPADIFFGGDVVEILLQIFWVTAVLFCTAVYCWNRGLRVYSSASS